MDRADGDILIAPLLLIVFVENAFKHAKNSMDPNIFIAISLQVEDGYIHFTAVNSYDAALQERAEPADQSGFGQLNARKRLEALYGNACQLKTSTENDLYTVDLRIKIVYGKNN